MLIYCHRLIALVAFMCSSLMAVSQDSSSRSLPSISIHYPDKISAKTKTLEEKLDKKSTKALQQLQKQEAKMKRKLMKIDSLAANNVFANADKQYKDLAQRLNGSRAGPYIPKMDTLVTSLKFLQDNPQLFSQAKEVKEKVKDALGKVNGLKDQFQKAEEIKKFLKERKQFLKEQLSKFGFAKELKKINKEVYYYAQQVNEYKEILKDSKKTERKAIELLSKTKLFKDFMRKNSQLASLFKVPGDPSDPSSQASLAGLQTRAQVNGLIQQQLAAGGPGAQQQFQQNIQAAQSQLQQLKSKILKAGGSNSNDEVPDFKPNGQKTKGFLQRLEYGTNVQTQKASSFFPVTTDLGLSVGYKLNDKSVIGIGASYKMGLGRGWDHMRFTSEGIGLRSFIDWKLKMNLWISGGYEMNYKAAFNSIRALQNYSSWQQSGLLGLSKKVDIKTKFFKNTKLQLLWDFMSYRQIPKTQPIVVRINYNFK